MVKESQKVGRVHGTLNSTFLCLIPKKENVVSFGDFKPISCCNVVYKIISKIIARRIRLVLSEVIGEEQFIFLQNRKIHDAVAMAQEVLHMVKIKNQKAVILKLDLSKAYDRVSWTFLHLALLQIGLCVNVVNWIMDCVQSASFAVLVNGSPSHFFKSLRGLSKGCPLSPFMFLLIAEGLSRLIREARANASLRGVMVSNAEMISHLLFIDDVLFCVFGSLRDVSILKRILDHFYRASGMVFNPEKSCLVINNCSEEEVNYFSALILAQARSIDEGLKYLGFFLKPTNYKKVD
jgi:hypothetical protein